MLFSFISFGNGVLQTVQTYFLQFLLICEPIFRFLSSCGCCVLLSIWTFIELTYFAAWNPCWSFCGIASLKFVYLYGFLQPAHSSWVWDGLTCCGEILTLWILLLIKMDWFDLPLSFDKYQRVEVLIFV